MLNWLRGRNSLYNKANQHGLAISPKKPEYGGDMGHEDKIDYMLDEVAHTLIPKLKSDFLKAVLFGITAEMRHVPREMGDYKNFSANIADGVGERYAKIYNDFFSYYNYDNFKDKMAEFNKSVPVKDRMFRNVKNFVDPHNADFLHYNMTGRMAAYRSMLKGGSTERDFVEMAKFTFANGSWQASYGGQPWANACDGWLQLYDSKGENSDIVAIDHIYDLQHNNGSVLNKVAKYIKGGNTTWLKTALDDKAQSNGPMDIVDKVSSSMRELALPAIKLKFGTTYQDKASAEISPYKGSYENQYFLTGHDWSAYEGAYHSSSIPELKLVRLGLYLGWSPKKVTLKDIERLKNTLKVPQLDDARIKKVLTSEYNNKRNIETGNFKYVKVKLSSDLIREIDKFIRLKDTWLYEAVVKKIDSETHYGYAASKYLYGYCASLVGKQRSIDEVVEP
jgi:hypothetical protein